MMHPSNVSLMVAVQEVALALCTVPALILLTELFSKSRANELFRLRKLVEHCQVKPLWPDWRQTSSQQPSREASARRSAEDDTWPTAGSSSQGSASGLSINQKRKNAATDSTAKPSKQSRGSKAANARSTQNVVDTTKAAEKAILLRKLRKAKAKKARKDAAAKQLPAVTAMNSNIHDDSQGQPRLLNKARRFIRDQLSTRAGSSGRSAGIKLLRQLHRGEGALSKSASSSTLSNRKSNRCLWNAFITSHRSDWNANYDCGSSVSKTSPAHPMAARDCRLIDKPGRQQTVIEVEAEGSTSSHTSSNMRYTAQAPDLVSDQQVRGAAYKGSSTIDSSSLENAAGQAFHLCRALLSSFCRKLFSIQSRFVKDLWDAAKTNVKMPWPASLHRSKWTLIS